MWLHLATDDDVGLDVLRFRVDILWLNPVLMTVMWRLMSSDVELTYPAIDGNVVELNVLSCWADRLGTILPLTTIMLA